MLRKLTVDGPDGLQWTVKRLLVPVGIRPQRTDVLDYAAPRRLAIYAPTGPTPLGFLLALPVLPFVPLLVLLRSRGWMPWTIEARTYMWGKRYPPMVLRYEVRGSCETALDELAAALVRGDGAPVLAGVERI